MNDEGLDSIIQNCLPAAAGGDPVAYGRIVSSCQGMVTSIAWAIVRDVPTSEDIAQDAFLSVWQNLRKLANPASFLPWLRQITRNLARDHLRAQSYRSNPEGDIEAIIAAIADPSPGPDQALAEQQQARLAAALIDALPDDSRDALLLYYRERQSSKRVADLLGLQDATVRKRISRARQSVRNELLAHLGDYASQTTPTIAFTTAVLGSISLGSAPVAAGTVATGGALLGKSTGKGLLGLVGSVGFGVLVGLSGVWWGLGRYLRAPLDEEERRALLVYGSTMSLWVAAFVAAVGIVSAASSGWQWPLLATAVFSGGALALQQLWLPRILSRRRALELRAVANSKLDSSAYCDQLHARQAHLTLLRSNIQRALSGKWTAWGYYRYLRAPLDAAEKSELQGYALVQSLLVIGFVFGILRAAIAPDWRVVVLVSMLYVAAMAGMSQLWLPRILKRRLGVNSVRM